VLGSLAGILTANRLVVYRIEQLEAKVSKHNNLVERIYRLEARVDNLPNTGREKETNHEKH